jgi:biopolymer transport protein ExbD
MARKAQENPQLDMTPMIDVVFELIIFFVVTLTQAQAKDETIKLEDGRHGIELTPEELPPTTLQVDIARNGRISMGNITLTPEQIGQRVKERKRKFGGDFPILIRADYRTRHEAVARVMNACTAAGVWKISFMAVYERKAKD